MRILTISNTPHDPDKGSGYVITNYVNGLRSRGHEVDAYGPEDYLPYKPRRARRYIYPLMMAWFGFQKVREKKYDLVECYGAASWILVWLLAKTDYGAALAHHANGIEPHANAARERAAHNGLIQGRRWFQADLTSVQEIGFRSVDTIVTVSDFDADYVRRQKYVASGNVHAIENPLPESMLGRTVSYDRPKCIGYCGPWSDHKGKQVMLEDVPSFLRTHPAWTFKLVGVGKGFDPKEHFPKGVQDRIEAIPFLKRADLIKWYSDLSILMCPSLYESFGLVQAEAMACGAALVATEASGYAASLEDRREYMRLPAPQSPHLLDALDALAENDDLRRRMAENGYERVQGLRWNPAVDRLETIYEDLVRRKRAVA